MARIDWIEQRLQNWARWRAMQGGAGCLGFSGVELGDSDGGRSGYVTASIPTIDVEASETDAAVQLLYPGAVRMTVIEFYLGSGGEVDKARRLVCSRATWNWRVDRAHQQLATHFAAVHAKRRDERARVEALQIGLHPR